MGINGKNYIIGGYDKCEKCGEKDVLLRKGSRKTRHLLQDAHIRPPIGKLNDEFTEQINNEWEQQTLILCPNCHLKFDHLYPEILTIDNYREYVIDYLRNLKFPTTSSLEFLKKKKIDYQ